MAQLLLLLHELQGFQSLVPMARFRHLSASVLRSVTTTPASAPASWPRARYGMPQLKSGLQLQYSNGAVAGEGEDEDVEEEDDEGEEEAEQTPGSSNDGAPAIPVEAPTISLVKHGVNFPSTLNGSDVRVGIIMTRWNPDIIQGLYKGLNESLTECGVQPSNVFTTYVPGAFEIPITAKFMTMSKRFDVIVCLGCLIKGDTMHFEYIAQAASQGIMQVSLDTMVPCIFGVLTVLNKEQAVVRSQGSRNEGLSWGKTAVEMALARMSALGQGTNGAASKAAQTAADNAKFVAFNGTTPATVTPTVTPKEGNETTTVKPTPKKFGF